MNCAVRRKNRSGGPSVMTSFSNISCDGNDRQRKGQPSRLEKGNAYDLQNLVTQWRDVRAEFHVTIVQPGYSKAHAERPHLDLLAAAESFLMETWRIPFRAMTSA